MPLDTIPTSEPSATTGPPAGQRGRRELVLVALAIAVMALGGVIYAGIASRVNAENVLTHKTSEAAVASVTVIHPATDTTHSDISLPGYTQAFTDTSIYARTSGYLKAWHYDIGAHVKKGDLLAEIGTPEVDQQLRQARADLVEAQANLALATITAKRDENLLKTRAVSTQDRDNSSSVLAASEAIVLSKAANVARLEQLQSYEKVTAPFDGVITARNTDVGALIAADANAPAKELFHLAAINKLRIYVSIPEVYDQAVQTGAVVAVTLDEFPGRNFDGTVVRNANAIDQASRTLLAEVDVDNPHGLLLPGAYTFVHLSLPESDAAITVPSNTLLFRREGLRVAVVRDSHAELLPVAIGRDYGEKVEIISGLRATDNVIIDPSDSLISGATVLVENAKQG